MVRIRRSGWIRRRTIRGRRHAGMWWIRRWWWEMAKGKAVVATESTVMLRQGKALLRQSRLMMERRGRRLPRLVASSGYCLLFRHVFTVRHGRQNLQSLTVDALVMTLDRSRLSDRVETAVSVVGVGHASRHHAAVLAAEFLLASLVSSRLPNLRCSCSPTRWRRKSAPTNRESVPDEPRVGWWEERPFGAPLRCRPAVLLAGVVALAADSEELLLANSVAAAAAA